MSEIHSALLEVGCLLCEPLSPVQRAASERAVAALREQLEAVAPAYEWRWPRYEDHVKTRVAIADVMDLIERGLERVTVESLDFLFIFTGRPLADVEGERLYAAGSSTAGIGIVSLVDPQTVSGDGLHGLMLDLFRHMAGLADTGEEHGSAPPGREPDGRPMPPELDDRQRAALVMALQGVADLRIEERGIRAGIGFYLASAAENWRQVVHSLVRARPWLMPLHLSRLTTAAASALFVLMMTAEVWELGMAQSTTAVIALSALVLAATALYVLIRQRLLQTVRPGRLTEQVAVMRISVTLSMLIGLLSTYAFLFSVCFVAALALYPGDLVTRWSASASGMVGWSDYLGFAGFVSAIGVTIGALGASFERQNHLKQLALLDRRIERQC